MTTEHSSPVTADSPDGPCFYCGEPTVSYAGNPGLWPLRFCQRDGTGITRYHHTHCVTDRLNAHAQAQPEAVPPSSLYSYPNDEYDSAVAEVSALRATISLVRGMLAHAQCTPELAAYRIEWIDGSLSFSVSAPWDDPSTVKAITRLYALTSTDSGGK